MRLFTLLVVLLLVGGVAALVHALRSTESRATVADGEGIAWQTSLPEETARPVLIDFTADWCPPCKVMEQEAWPDAEIVEAMNAYTPVKIDIDADPDTAAKYKVASIPTLLVLAPDGSVLARREGYTYGGQADLAAFLRKHAED